MYQKTLSLSDCQIKLNDGGHFSGYASTFDGVDQGGDTILKGAYADTLATHGMPKMYLQHEHNELPIGKWLSAKEDDRGLLVEGEFTPGMTRAAEARASLKHGTVDGLSIGYVLRAKDYEEQKDGTRVIRSVSVLREISLVTFPMDLGARVDLHSVKSEDIEQLETIRDFERLLRDVGAFDQVTAKRLVTKARELFAQRDVGDESEAAVSELEGVLAKLKSSVIAVRH